MHHAQHHTDSPPPAVDSRLPGPFDDEMPPQDPGSSSSRFLALAGAILLTLAAIVWQHLPSSTQFKVLNLNPPPQTESLLVLSPLENTALIGKMIVRLSRTLEANPASLEPLKESLLKGAKAPEAQIVTAIVWGELDGPQAALDQLAQIQSTATDQSIELQQDLKDLTTVYLAGSGTLDDHSISRLRDRYDYFATVALTHSLDESSSEYTTPRSGGLSMILSLTLFGGTLLLASLAGFVLLILGLVRYASTPGLARFDPPAPGGSVMLETYALFVGLFLSLSFIGTVLDAKESEWVSIMLPAQFLLMGVVLWPMLRGMKFADWRKAVGLTAPRGILREIGFGFLAYLATIPLYIVSVIISVTIMLLPEIIRRLSGGAPDDSGVSTQVASNPIIDLLVKGDWVFIATLFVMATLWAPITEELIFRGSLYRHLRGRLHWILAALLSASLFAGIHNYPMIMTVQVFVLGSMFAVMRETRGSIVASMTAHFIHNTSNFIMMIFVLRPLLV